LSRRDFFPDIVTATGVSARLSGFASGHVWHVVVAASLYATLCSVSVFMEVAYQYDRYARMAWTAAPLVWLWMSASTLGILAFVARRARQNRSALVSSTLLLVAAAAILYAVFRPFLPAHAITQATFQTYTAQAAYLKDLIYFVPFAAVFLLPPFHFIVRMQAALVGGQHRAVASVVLAERYAIPPSGVLYPRVWALSALLVVGAIVSMISGAHLLENLKPTEYSNLFIHTVQFRWLVYLALGLETLAWYHHALTEVRRECLVRQRLA
jgi:hypothetical protein